MHSFWIITEIGKNSSKERWESHQMEKKHLALKEKTRIVCLRRKEGKGNWEILMSQYHHFKPWSSNTTWSLDSKPNIINPPLPGTLFRNQQVNSYVPSTLTLEGSAHSFIHSTNLYSALLFCSDTTLKQELVNYGLWAKVTDHLYFSFTCLNGWKQKKKKNILWWVKSIWHLKSKSQWP